MRAAGYAAGWVLVLAGSAWGQQSTPPERMLTRGPYLQNGTSTSVVVRWSTSLPTNSIVRWGVLPDQLVSSTGSPWFTKTHVLTINGLAPNSTYYYSVGDSLGTLAGGDHGCSFETFPLPGQPTSTRIWILGDSGTADANAAAVRDAYYAYSKNTHTDLWLMLGDNAYNVGSVSEYQAAVFDMYPAMLRKSVLFSTRGNHENSEAVYYGQFTFPTQGEAGGMPSGSEAYYSFDHANVHFVCLDSYKSSRGSSSPMLTWLKSDLASTAQDWIVAYWHHPPYTKGSHNSDDPIDSEGRMFDMRRNVLPILERYGVDLVFCGHSHSYERSFLIDGHYDVSTTFDPATMLIDGGNGRVSGDGAYAKSRAGNLGAVYSVAGCSGKTGGGHLDHPVMFTSINQLGSVVLDVNGKQLNARFLGVNGLIADSFTLTTRYPEPILSVPPLVAGQTAGIHIANATPGAKLLLGISITGAGPTSTPFGDAYLSQPIRVLGPYTAGRLGEASLSVPVPGNALGVPVWLQALEVRTSTQGWFSNLVRQIVQ